MKIWVSLFCALSLAACVTEEKATEDSASAVASPTASVPAQPVATATPSQDFFWSDWSTEKQTDFFFNDVPVANNTSGYNVSVEQLRDICKSIIPHQTNIREVVTQFGLPHSWNNARRDFWSSNWHSVETFSYRDARGFLGVIYDRDGIIRGAHYYLGVDNIQWGTSEGVSPNGPCQ